MDEMNNMNEVTTEETSMEVTPVVAENNEVHEEANSLNFSPIAAVVGGVALVGGAGYALYKKHKAKKADKKEKVEKKPKKHFKLRSPIVIEKDEPVEENVEHVDDSAVEIEED